MRSREIRTLPGRRLRVLLAVAVLAATGSGCSSTTAGTAGFSPIPCTGEHAVRADDGSFCFVSSSTLHDLDGPSGAGIFVGTDRDNIIDVRADPVDNSEETRALSDADLLQRFSTSFRARNADNEFKLDLGSGRVVYTAAGRSIGYDGRDTSSDGLVTENVIFGAGSILQVICAWTDRGEVIRPACEKALQSVRLTGS